MDVETLTHQVGIARIRGGHLREPLALLRLFRAAILHRGPRPRIVSQLLNVCQLVGRHRLLGIETTVDAADVAVPTGAVGRIVRVLCVYEGRGGVAVEPARAEDPILRGKGGLKRFGEASVVHCDVGITA